jgi:Ni,Fe-hydrogenase III component G
VTLSLRTSVAKANPVLDTITPIIPGAILYEREIQDLLGLKVKGHPDPRRLVLPEGWPEGVYPLRKEYKVKVEEG